MTPIVDVGLGYNYWLELMYEILWKGASYGLEYIGRIWEPRRQHEQHQGSRCYSSVHTQHVFVSATALSSACLSPTYPLFHKVKIYTRRLPFSSSWP